jgi:hypothetical protein
MTTRMAALADRLSRDSTITRMERELCCWLEKPVLNWNLSHLVFQDAKKCATKKNLPNTLQPKYLNRKKLKWGRVQKRSNYLSWVGAICDQTEWRKG